MVIPAALLSAMLAVALIWGWPRWAGLTAMGFVGLLHPDEFPSPLRRDLVFPADAFVAGGDAFLHISSPKTRRFARQQHARQVCLQIVLLGRAC